MTASIEVKDESYKQREAEKERRKKAEDFGPSYTAIWKQAESAGLRNAMAELRAR